MARVPHLVRRRTIEKWEKLVGRAIEAEEGRTLHGSHWNEYTNTPFVPQILHQQKKNIDNILQTARNVQVQYPQVARICTSNLHLFFLVKARTHSYMFL